MFNPFEGTFLEWLFPSYLFGFGFGGGKKSSGGGGTATLQPQIPSWQSGLGEDLSAWTRKYLQNYVPGQPFSGQLGITQPSTFEQLGLKELGGVLGQPATGDLFGAAKGNIIDTLGGRFMDPATSPFIQAATKLAGQNLQDQITTARGQRGARGTYFTRAGLQEERQLGERTQNSMNALIADYINQERGRQQQAVPMAQSLEQYGLEAPLKRVAASQTLGALPRLLQQSDLERQYQDFLRQRSELGQVPGVGQSVFGRNVPMGFGTQFTAPMQSSPGFFQQTAPFLQTAMQILPFLL